jgi:hypothetical protein
LSIKIFPSFSSLLPKTRGDVDWFIPAWFVLASGQLSHRLAFWQSTTFSTPQTCVGVRVRDTKPKHTRDLRRKEDPIRLLLPNVVVNNGVVHTLLISNGHL